ncbi:MAG: hypothetical protein FJZ08_03060 [Candidatus Omnitrophica bacterium]|nr:hypothetical protein [Candidatus Omnitrophota bacterium]
MRKKILFAFLLAAGAFLPLGNSSAQELTILYSGETHAMIYPCNCLVESDGGVARRAALVKQLRRENPNLLLLDSGGFFAGGPMDEYTLNTELDIQRTRVNLKAMALMKYDAQAIGDEEFNFGAGFLKEYLKDKGLTFLSCNIVSKDNTISGIKPYIIKEVSGLKVGIIGLTPMAARQKAQGFEFSEPAPAVAKAVADLKKQGAGLIVLLSHQGEADDLKLLKEVSGIDVVIIGQNRMKEESYTKSGNTLVIKPFWQGRRLGKLTLKITKGKVADYKIEELRLSDKINDDPEVLPFLPRCFSDSRCKEKGMLGTCLNPGGMASSCVYSQAPKVSLLVITSKNCLNCNAEKTVNRLRSLFPGLSESYLYYPETEAEKMINKLQINSLPAFLLGKESEKDKGFNSLKENVELRGNFYFIKPGYGGLGYFPHRSRIKDRLDLFISLYDKDIAKLLEAIKEFKPIIHFLAVRQNEADFGSAFAAARGNIEAEEYLRAVCVQKYYPDKFYDYITCRAKNTNTSWWQDCLVNCKDSVVSDCARSEEGKSLLTDNISLNRELEIMFGPTYLLDNQEIFSTDGVPTKEDFNKLFKKQ